MDIFFQDPSEVPLPPEEVRIRQVRAEPWPDGRRVRVTLEIDPFQRRPNAELYITDPQGEQVAQASVIEPMGRKMEFTMHLREPQPAGLYTLHVVLFYSEPLPLTQPGESDPTPLELPGQTVVDRTETTFEVVVSESQS